jgi:hypothetical protein
MVLQNVAVAYDLHIINFLKTASSSLPFIVYDAVATSVDCLLTRRPYLQREGAAAAYGRPMHFGYLISTY